MPRHRLVAKFLNFLRRNAEPPHGVGHLADDAEVVAGTMKSDKDVGVFGGHRGETMRSDMLVGASARQARKRTSGHLPSVLAVVTKQFPWSSFDLDSIFVRAPAPGRCVAARFGS